MDIFENMAIADKNDVFSIVETTEELNKTTATNNENKETNKETVEKSSSEDLEQISEPVNLKNKLELKIKIFGVGGAGNNMLQHLHENYLQDYDTEHIELVAVNTDIQVLNKVKTNSLSIGTELTQGLGAGMKPEVGKEAAMESYNEISAAMEGVDMVFVACGMGGGTGTGASPIVAKAAKEKGILTIGIATKPFAFEGRKKKRFAQEGIDKLEEFCDSLIIIENDKLMKSQNHNLSFKLAFKMIDNVLAKAVQGIIGILLDSGENDINVDFADLKTILSDSGHSIMSIGNGIGDNAAYEAVEKAMTNHLLSYSDISGSTGVLIHFSANPNYPLEKLYEAMGLIEDKADEEATIIFGTSSTTTGDENEVTVTLIATGFHIKEEDNLTKIAANLNQDSIIQPIAHNDINEEKQVLRLKITQ